MRPRLAVAVAVAVLLLLGDGGHRDDLARQVHITATTTAPTADVVHPPLVFVADVGAARGPIRQVAPDPFVPLIDPRLPCQQWLDLALDVGWPLEELDEVAYVMNRESKCNPNATGVLVCNPRGCARALGLLQLLGWSCPPGGCYDPRSNLAKAVELWRSSGWRSWCLRGDPVTGSC